MQFDCSTDRLLAVTGCEHTWARITVWSRWEHSLASFLPQLLQRLCLWFCHEQECAGLKSLFPPEFLACPHCRERDAERNLVGFLLIGVAAWGKGLGVVSSIHIIGGVIAVGVFLLLIAVAGLVGAANHHQVLLFFYMIILGLVFIFQFGISCSCLAINRNTQVDVINASWSVLSNSTRHELERSFDCCGLFNLTTLRLQDDTSCSAVCKTKSSTCQMCGERFLKHSDKALKILGGVGLFFSFTEILGVWLAMRFRNQKDPRANPSAFL